MMALCRLRGEAMRNAKGQYCKGPSDKRVPVGTISIHRWTTRNKKPRAFVKVAQPNEWILRAHVVWRQHNGPILPGYSIHHKDDDPLNDDIGNLEMLSRANHLERHRTAERQAKAVAGWIKARRERRWSTKSKTKRNGPPAPWTMAQMKTALDDYFSCRNTPAAVSRRHNINHMSVRRHIKWAEDEGRTRDPLND